jgi:hypothetical protein
MKKAEFVKVHAEWIPLLNKLIPEIDAIDNLWDREKAVILLIAAGYFLNKEAVKKKDAQTLIALCMDTVFAVPK